MLRFKQLWQVDFIHQYYTVRPYQPFRVIPTPATARQMQAYGLLMKASARGFFVASKAQDAVTDLQYLLYKPVKLVFTITCDDPLLLNYSSLSLEDVTQSFLLSNQHEATDGTTYLHTGVQLSEADLMIPVTGYNDLDAYFNHEDTISCYLINQVNSHTPFFTGTYEAFKAVQTFDTLLDMPHFSIRHSGTSDVLNFYAWANRLRNVFAILEMTLTPPMATAPAPTRYVVTIGARAISWRYNIIEKPQRSFSDFILYAGKQALSLKPITTRTLADGSTAVILEPVDPILLSETYDAPFEIEFNQTDSKAGKLSSRRRLGLPIPDIERIKISARHASAYSDMYIHI
jgi:hypothetical protein